MSKRSSRRPGARTSTPVANARTTDSFENLIARTGIGAGSQQDASQYVYSPVSRNRTQMEAVYRSSWLAGQAVDSYAEDMTRAGIELRGEIAPDDMESLGKAANRLQLWDSICDTIKWARLYGGAIAVMQIDGQKPETPLNPDSIAEGQFKGLTVMDRWMVQPTLSDLVQDLGVDFAKPRFYDVLGDTAGMKTMRIHYSRVIRVDGVDLPYWQRIAEMGWGQSVLERLWDRLIPYDSITQGAAQLVYKAHLRTYKVAGLRDIIAVGGKAYEGLLKQINMIRQFQSNEGMTLMDASDEFEVNAYSFAGLSDMMLQFGQQISGATGIPLVRLFGQSPAGLGATGESEIRQYYDNVKQQQERKLRSGVSRLFGVLHRSVLGAPPPESFDFEFCPLWQMSDEQKSTIALNVTQAVTAASDSGVIDRATALKELRQSSQVTGIFSNVSDEDITEAENEPPPSMNEMEVDPDGDPNRAEEATAPGSTG